MHLSAKAHLPLLACCLLVSAAHAQTPLRLSPLPDTDPAFDNTGVTYTAEDLADPPPGEIRKQYVTHDVKDLRTALAANLTFAPAGPEGKDSPWMPKFQAVLRGLDQIMQSRLQRDVFLIIPKMQEIFAARDTPGFSEFFKEQRQLLRSLGVTVYHAIAEHVSDQNAQVAAADLALFVQVMADGNFYFGPDWEDELVPIDAPDLFILDPAAVVAQLQALPWKKAEEFLHGDTAAEAFENYAASGSGLSVLKTRFAAHQADIIDKWNELTAWVAQQIAATAPPKTDLVIDQAALAKLPIMPVVTHYLAATMSAEITDGYWELITKHSRGINGGVVTKAVLPLGKAGSNEFLILLSSTGEQLTRGNGQGGTLYSFYLCTGKGFKNLDEVMAEQNEDMPLNLEGHGVRDGNRIYFARTSPPRPVRSWVLEFGLRNGQFFYQLADIAAGALPEKDMQRFIKREHIQEWSAMDPFPEEQITLAELIRSPSPQWHAELDDEAAMAQAKDLTAQEFRDWLRPTKPSAEKGPLTPAEPRGDDNQVYVGITKEKMKPITMRFPWTIGTALLHAWPFRPGGNRAVCVLVRGGQVFLLGGETISSGIEDLLAKPGDCYHRYSEADVKAWNLPILQEADAIRVLKEEAAKEQPSEKAPAAIPPPKTKP